jgi:protein O-mannosyl-transferase
MKRDLAIAAALVIATLAVYAQTLGFDFVDFDDNLYVTHNPWVKAGLGVGSVRAAFTEPRMATNWLPLSTLSYMLDATLFGLNPVAFHAVNVMLQAIGVVLVFALLRTLTAAVWPSAIVAALFALHPMRVESVAWVSCRKDVLSALFGLFALLAYARYAVHGSRRAYVTSLLCTILALFAKTTWVALPALFLLLDFWPLRRFGPSASQPDAFPAPAGRRTRSALLFAEKLPFFAIAAAGLWWAIVVQSGLRVPTEDIPLGDRAVHAAVAPAWYVAKTLWPTRLSVHYPHPYFATVGGLPWTPVQIGLSVLLLVSISSLALRFARRGYPLVGWLWFLGTLVPVLGFGQYATQGMADRYTHLPHIGLFVAAVFGGWELIVPRLRNPAQRRIAAALGAAALIALGSAAAVQARVWRDSESLFTHALEVRPRDAMIQEAIAALYLRTGRFDDALRHSKAALDLHPDYRKARRILAQALQHRAAADPAPAPPDFLFDGGAGDAFVHEELAELEFARGNGEAALEHVRGALALTPDSIRALWQLGELLRERGDHAGSRDAFRRIVALAPDSNEAREALAAAERALAAPR